MSQNWTYDQNRHFDQPRGETAQRENVPQERPREERDQSPDRNPRQVAPSQPLRAGFHLALRPKALYALLKCTYQAWSDAKAPRMGAALAYYTIFSLAPLLVIAIAIAGIVFGPEAVQGQIVNQIQGLMGPDAARAVQTMIQSAHKPAHQAIASIIGLFLLFLGATGVFNEMQDALNEIWGIDTTKKSGIWSMLKTRFLSFGMVLGIGFLLLVSLLLSAALSAVAKYISGFLPVPPAVLHIADLLFSVFFITVLFAMIFKVLPDAKIPWSDVWVGAAMTAILFTIGKFLIGFYIGKSVTASAYGAAGSLVIIVAWIYYCAQLLYFGAEFTRVYATERGSQCAVAPEVQRARHGAPAHAHG
jgi:membrane protein